MTVLFTDPLCYVYFVYGVSFLIMAGLIVNGIARASSQTLVSSFTMLAAFGFTHGVTEMLDWVNYVRLKLGHAESTSLLYISQVLLIVSFVLLLQFGINILTYKNSQKKSPRLIPSMLVVFLLIVVYVAGISDIRSVARITRFSFGFTGSALSAIVLFRLIDTMRPLGNKKLNRGLAVAASSFVIYAICGGLIITSLFGLPIQLFRAICAFALAVSASSILDIFKVRE